MFVQESHAFAMFYAHELLEKREIPVVHAHVTSTTFTQFAQNSTVGCMALLCTWLHLSLALSDEAINLALLYDDIWTSFFC